MREYPFYTLDVFTREPFGGNPLALLPDARGLDTTIMQKIAREFHFSETAFVLPPQGEGDWRLRIFTPCAEMPFAGHPTIGAALALAHESISASQPPPATMVFEEEAGLVRVPGQRCRGRQKEGGPVRE